MSSGATTPAPDRRAVEALLFDRPIAFHPTYARVGGSVAAGVFLSQLLYWHGRGADPDGWIWKTQREWQDETALSPREQVTARKQLVARGILEERRRGLPAQLYYRVNVARLMSVLAEPQYAAPNINAKRESSVAESADLESRHAHIQSRAKRETYHTEKTTQEDTRQVQVHRQQKTPASPLPRRDPPPAPAEAPERVWGDVLGVLRAQTSRPNYATYLADTQLVALTADCATIQAPRRQQAEWLAERWPALLERALAGRLGRSVRCRVVCG